MEFYIFRNSLIEITSKLDAMAVFYYKYMLPIQKIVGKMALPQALNWSLNLQRSPDIYRVLFLVPIIVFYCHIQFTSLPFLILIILSCHFIL